jgi:hypothetical protein
MTGLLIESGIGWKPDPKKPGWVTTVLDGDYVAEITRLIEENAELKKRVEQYRALTTCLVGGLHTSVNLISAAPD